MSRLGEDDPNVQLDKITSVLIILSFLWINDRCVVWWPNSSPREQPQVWTRCHQLDSTTTVAHGWGAFFK